MDGSLQVAPVGGAATMTPEQALAVESFGNLIVFACPGSGKTFTLAAKAHHMLEANPKLKMGAVTFTNESADELRTRIVDRNPMYADRVVVGTFHYLCRQQLNAGGVKRVPLLSPFEQQSLIRDAWRKAAPSSTLGAVTEEIERGKSVLTPRIANIDRSPLEAAFQYYQEQLERLSKWDISDLIRNTVLMMRENSIPALDVDVLLVDEFQDADEIQHEWVMLHASAGAEVTVVGDDDQSLYGWRHATGYRGMVMFQKGASAQMIRLDYCFRCAPKILDHARQLIEHNAHRENKALIAMNTDVDGVVEVMRFENDAKQAQAIIERIQDSDGTWAVLARTNSGLDVVDASLSAANIPFERIGGKRFWEGKYPGFYLSLLNALCTGDRTGVDLLFGTLPLREHTQDRLRKAVPRRGQRNNLDTLLAYPPALDGCSEGDVRLLETWLDYLRECVDQARGNRPNVMLYGLAERLAPLFGGDYAKNILHLCAQSLCKIPGTLIQRLALVKSSTDKRKKPSKKPRITLVTLHGAKGLEWDRVWMVNVEERTLPHHRGEVPEERRLAYVGMTRAREELVISYRTGDPIGDGQTTLLPSRFITEAGLQHLG